MAVYVDNARIPFGRMLMCHMIADSIDELTEMADRIGLQRRHFQDGSHPHFDVSVGYRKKALDAGALAVDRRDLVEAMRRYRVVLQENPEEAARLEAVRRLYGLRRTPA